MQLLTAPAYVESPFVILRVGEYTFGTYSQETIGTGYRVTYPNFMQSITVAKVNGAVNTYTIRMVYGITQFDDPNLLDKVFSSVSKSRKIYISYGDWNAPSFIYKEESAIITKIQTSVDVRSSQISYTISAVSDAMYLNALRTDFPKRVDKPSTVIRELLQNKAYGLVDIFPGMSNIDKVFQKGLIPVNDKRVTIEAKRTTTTFDYLNYLVGCMVPENANTQSGIPNSRYYLTVVDEVNPEFGGAYFKITGVLAGSTTYDLSSVYELDVGYPGNTMVTAFSLNQDDSWALLYDYSQKIDEAQKSYVINNDGTIETLSQPNLATSYELQMVTQANKNWWSNMTNFPIKANVTIKGLLRPTILMSQVLVNVLFYGKKHVSTGLYIITKHEDVIDRGGYRTNLSLTRIGGDTI